MKIKGLESYDLHIHSFSHCVFCKRGEIPWEESAPSICEKMEYIEKSLDGIACSAEKNGLRTIGISEHPQFRRYGIDYNVYSHLLRSMRLRHKGLKILSGLELNVTNGFGLSLEDIVDDRSGVTEFLDEFQFVTLGIHQGITLNHKTIWRKFITKKDYLETLLSSLCEIRCYYDGPVILAHPWRSAAFGLDAAGEEFGGRFNYDELKIIADSLIKNRIVPEFNGASIYGNSSDIFFENGSILSTYVETCKQRGKRPVISLGSDSHNFDSVGKTFYRKVDEKLHLTGKTDIWCDSMD